MSISKIEPPAVYGLGRQSRLKNRQQIYANLPVGVPFLSSVQRNYHLEMVALIQRPAPTFKAEAVVEGLFLDISLTDYLGQWCVDNNLHRCQQQQFTFFSTRRVVLLFYPMLVFSQPLFLRISNLLL